MSIKNIIVGLCLISSLLGFPSKLIAEPLEIVNPVNLTLDEQISYFSKLYQVDVSLIRKVIECESGYNHKTSSDNGYSNGIMQFQKSTFLRMSKLFGEELDYGSEFDQLKLGIWALSKPELAREWTTYVAIKNGGKYSFYSNQLKKNFTIYCKL